MLGLWFTILKVTLLSIYYSIQYIVTVLLQKNRVLMRKSSYFWPPKMCKCSIYCYRHSPGLQVEDVQSRIEIWRHNSIQREVKFFLRRMPISHMHRYFTQILYRWSHFRYFWYLLLLLPICIKCLRNWTEKWTRNGTVNNRLKRF